MYTINLALSARTVKLALKTKEILGVARVLAQYQNSEEYMYYPCYKLWKRFEI